MFAVVIQRDAVVQGEAGNGRKEYFNYSASDVAGAVWVVPTAAVNSSVMPTVPGAAICRAARRAGRPRRA